MLYIIRAKQFTPRYFNPAEGNVITADNVARFHGCHMGRMLRGFPSVDDTWSTRDSLNAVGAVKDSMPKAAYQDMYRCMHFSDDWEEEDGEEWDDMYANVLLLQLLVIAVSLSM